VNSTPTTRTVLHIIGSSGFGGGERYLLDLVGFSLEQYRHVAAVPCEGPLSRHLDSSRKTYRIIDMPLRISVSSVIKLCRLCREIKADIIHSHGFRSNIYGRLVAVLCRKQHVATIHVSLYDYLETSAAVRQVYQWVEKWSSFVTRPPLPLDLPGAPAAR